MRPAVDVVAADDQPRDRILAELNEDGGILSGVAPLCLAGETRLRRQPPAAANAAGMAPANIQELAAVRHLSEPQLRIAWIISCL